MSPPLRMYQERNSTAHHAPPIFHHRSPSCAYFSWPVKSWKCLRDLTLVDLRGMNRTPTSRVALTHPHTHYARTWDPVQCIRRSYRTRQPTPFLIPGHYCLFALLSLHLHRLICSLLSAQYLQSQWQSYTDSLVHQVQIQFPSQQLSSFLSSSL